MFRRGLILRIKGVFGRGESHRFDRVLCSKEVLGGRGTFEKLRLLVRIASPGSIAEGLFIDNVSITLEA